MKTNLNNNLLIEDINRISEIMFQLNEAGVGAAATVELNTFIKNEVKELVSNEVKSAIKKMIEKEGADVVKAEIKNGARELQKAAAIAYENVYKAFKTAVKRDMTTSEKQILQKEIAYQIEEQSKYQVKSTAAKIASTAAKIASNVKTGVKNITTKIKNLANGGKKELKPTVAKTSQVESQMAKIGAKEEQELIEGITKKGWNWARVKKWGIPIGIGMAALWFYFHDKDKVPAPSDIPENNSNLGGSGTSGTSGSKYTKCSEELPIEQYCKNETIRKVQACLAMPSDYQTGNFGPITQGYLEGKGQNGTLITTETIIAVCGTNSDIAGATAGKTGYEDYTTDEIEYSDDVQNTKSDTPQPVSPSTPKSTTPTSASPSTPKSAVPFSSEIPGLQSSKKSFANRTMDSDEIE
jgi:hypothetical protein